MTKKSFLPLHADDRPEFKPVDTIIEVKSDIHSFRNLRAALLQLAYYIAEAPQKHGVLVLTNPRITDAALQKEWRLVRLCLRPEILKRLALAVRREEEVFTIAGKLPTNLASQLPQSVDQEAGIQRYPAPQSTDAVLLVLLNQWFLRKGPMTTQWLIQAVGCSYPTAANALRRLERAIKRFSDRRFQLWGFPLDQWQRLVANRERAHPTVRYVDRSRQRRGAESLLHSASGLGRRDIAVGGVIAARHYYPEFDLRGTPRLDLTLHSPDGRADLSFVENIDPALECAAGPDEPTVLAVHVLRRQVPFFATNDESLPWADPVATLLGLYDARLESQATGLLDHLVTGAE